jgi:hypothetical protein
MSPDRDGNPIICDGCYTREGQEHWEHRCHEHNIMVFGERTNLDCECKRCHPTEEEMREFREALNKEAEAFHEEMRRKYGNE